MKRRLFLLVSIFLVFLPSLALAAPEDGQAILGPPTTSVDRMRAWALSKGADPDFVDQAQNFYDISVEWGVDPAVTYAQSAKETNFFKFTGVVDKDFHNPCGLKTSKGGGDYDPKAHNVFESWEEGITAQVHHLALYAGHEDFPLENTPDPRHFPGVYGKAKVVEELGKNWAPSYSYGNEIVEMMREFADVTSTYVKEDPDKDIKKEVPEEVSLVRNKPQEEDREDFPLRLSGRTREIRNMDSLLPIRRIFGGNRTKTSLEIAKFLDIQEGGRLILAPGDDFTGALLASSLVKNGEDYSPIILAGPLFDQGLLDEILKLYPSQVIIVASQDKVNPSYDRLLEASGVQVVRIFGSNRYETAYNIAKYSDSSQVILANGTNFADAMTISSYAAQEKMPILFTDGHSLDKNTASYLKKADSVLIVGGERSVSKAIEEDIKKNTRVERIMGKDRFDTGVKIAEEFYPSSSSVVVANGFDFPDSLAGAPLAAYLGGPILLTPQEKLDPALKAYIKSKNDPRINVLGGNSSVSPEVYKELSTMVK